MRPGRNEGGETVEPCGVGIGVGGDVHALRPGGVDFRHHFRHASPVGFSRNLEVPDFDRNVALAPDAQSFVDRGQNGIALVAHVRGVDAAEFRRLGGQRDQLLGLGVGSGRVLERSRDADGAVAHRLPDQFLHLIELCRRRLLVVVAQHHAPDLGGADVAGQIDAHALLFQTGEVLLKGAPVGRDVIVIVARAVGLDDGVIQRRDGTAFAGDLGGDALIDLRGQARIDQDGQLRLAQHVDEAGSDDHAVGVDGARALRVAQIADGGDLAVANADVARVPGRAGAVDDVAVGDDDVEGLVRGLCP